MKVAPATGEININKYLVETSHDREDCLHVPDQFADMDTSLASN